MFISEKQEREISRVQVSRLLLSLASDIDRWACVCVCVYACTLSIQDQQLSTEHTAIEYTLIEDRVFLGVFLGAVLQDTSLPPV